MKTSELTGAALDWAVEKANGTHWVNGYFCYSVETHPEFSYPYTSKTRAYSTDWNQAGPIIEREKISIDYNVGSFSYAFKRPCEISQRQYGPTPLIAAMRCYVASKLGDEVEIPEELR